MKIEWTNIIIALSTIIGSNILIVLGLVWRAGRWVSRIETRLDHLGERISTGSSDTNIRLNAIEARVSNLERLNQN